MIFLTISFVFPINVNQAESSEDSIAGWTVLGECPEIYYFINRTFGWAVAQDNPPRIFKTENGGETWNVQESPSSWGFAYLSDIYFWNASHGWITGANGIMGTLDGGETWFHLLKNPRVGNIVFVNSSHGWALQKDGSSKIYHTTNGGLNWTDLPNPTTYQLNDLTFVNDTLGWVVGDAGNILFTTDGGLSWHHQRSNVTFDLTNIQFIDEDHGWVASNNHYPPAILKTIDGESWTTKTFKGAPQYSSNGIDSMSFLNMTNGWATAQYSLWRTTDGGENWGEYLSRDDFNKAGLGYWGPSRIFFVDENVGWMWVGGKLLRTTRGGFQGESETTSTESTTETTTTSGEASTTEPTIGMESIYSLGVLVIMAIGLTRKQRKKQ